MTTTSNQVFTDTARATPPAHMGIFGTLAAEHDELVRLMAELADRDGLGTDAKRELFTRIAFRLAAHADAEDATFYGALASCPETQHEIHTSRREHAHIEALVEALRGRALDDAAWMDGFLELQYAVQRHIENEQHELFPCAHAVLTSAVADELDERYRARRDAGKSHL